MEILKTIKNYINGTVHRVTTHSIPIGQGTTVYCDGGKDVIFASCIEILAKNLAKQKWGLYDKNYNDKTNSLHRILNVEPFPGLNAYDFWTYVEKTRLSKGDCLLYIKYNKYGQLQALVPLDGKVTIYYDDKGIFEDRKIVYEVIEAKTNRVYTFFPDELLHFKAFSTNGLKGRPAIDVLTEVLQSNAESNGAIRSALANGFTGTVLLQYTSNLSQQAENALIKKVQNSLNNSNNNFMVLPSGMKADNLSNDLKGYYDVLYNANASSITGFFGVPLCAVNIGGGTGMATFSTTQMQMFFNQTMQPIVEQYKAELTNKLLTRTQKDDKMSFDTRCNDYDLLDAQSKATVLSSLVSAGIISPNEARQSLSYSNKNGADVLIQRGGTGAITTENKE